MNEWPEVDERKKRRLIAEHIEELESVRHRPQPVLDGSPLAQFVAARVRWGMPRHESETH